MLHLLDQLKIHQFFLGNYTIEPRMAFLVDVNYQLYGFTNESKAHNQNK